jgi:hypothetical protein
LKANYCKYGIFICLILLSGKFSIAQKNTYTEDLSVHTYTFEKVVFETTPKELKKDTVKDKKQSIYSGKNRNEQLAQLSDSVIAKNKNLIYSTGFRVLVYSGADRVKAMDCRKQVLKKYPTTHVYAIYHQPDWRIKVGDYDNRLEIQKIYSELLVDFPSAMIVPDQIFISTDKPAAKLQEEPILEEK